MLPPGIRSLLRLDIARDASLAQDLEDELRLHLELRAAQLEAQGISPDVAMAQARARFGAIDNVRRDNRQHARRSATRMRRRISFDSFVQDLRFAARTLARQKAWTAVAVLTLALGIGANTAVFSVVNDLLLDPLRYPHSERLALVSRVSAKGGIEVSPTRTLVEAWRTARSVDGIEGLATDDRTLETGAEPSVARTALVSPTFAGFTGARLIAGRMPSVDETKPAAAPVAVLSEHLWQARYGGSDTVLGQTLTLDGKKFTIIGILADGVRTSSYSTEPPDVWLPLPSDFKFLSGPAVVRLKPGVSLASAEQELRAIADGVDKTIKSMSGTAFNIKVREPGANGTRKDAVLLLAGAVSLLLLIACANVAHLLLARGAAREREMAIRAALGAGRARITRQLLTESLLLVTAGCIAGLGFGAVALRAIVAQAPDTMGELARVQVDGRVVLLTVGVSLLCCIGFGLVAGMQGPRGGRFSILRSSTGGSIDARRHRIRSLLVVTESALSVILLVGATLLIRTVVNLQRVDPGFDARGVYAMPVSLPEPQYGDAANRTLYATRLMEAARRIPGAREVTIAASAPMRSGVVIGQWMPEGATAAPSGDANGFTGMNTVSGDYFALMRMRLLGGRTFDRTSPQRREVIISQSLGRQLFGAANPVGLRFRMSNSNSTGPDAWNVVIGTVADANLLGLREDGRIGAIYYPAESAPEKDFTLMLRMEPGRSPVQALRGVALSLDPRLPPPPTLALTDLLAHSVANQRFIMSLLSVFAGLAVLLCAVGLYGVITYTVSQSTREIGIRIALGAARHNVAQLVMRQGVMLSAIGLVVGLVLSVYGTKLLQGSLYGVTTTDPVSYAIGGVVLMLLAIAACVAPTRRALRIDPMTAIRSE